MKRIRLIILLISVSILLTACGNGGDDKPVFKSVDSVPSPKVTAANEATDTKKDTSQETKKTVTESGNIETSGSLGAEGKITYALYKNGKLVLAGSDITIIVKDNDQLKDKVSKIKEIAFGSGVTKIDEEAFKDLTALEKVVFNDETESVGNYAFSGCTALTEVSFGGIKTIGDYAFDGCTKLSHVRLTKVETVGKYAFNKCAELGNVEFGAQLTAMGDNVFSNCGNLASVSFDSFVPKKALKGVSSVASVSIGENAESIGEYAFSECTNLQTIGLPSTIKTIGTRAFENCSKLTSISFSDAGQSSDVWICPNCNAKNYAADNFCSNCATAKDSSIVLATDAWICSNCNAINGAENNFCSNCAKPKDNNVKISAMSKKHVNLDIGSYAFSGCSNLNELILDVNIIDNYAFYECRSLKKIIISANSIGNNAFQGCSGLTDVNITVTGSIGNQAFAQCTSMTDLTIKANKIGNQAFQGCTLLCNVTLDSNDIGTQAFSDCGSITEIEVNAGKVGNQALEKCTGLKKATFSNPKAELGSKILMNCSIDQLVVAAKKIPDDCFASTNVKNVTMTTTVEEIGASAFEGCEMLTGIVMPSSITKIGNFAFKDCKRLEIIADEKDRSISIPKKVKSLGKRIFDGCEGIKTLEIQAEVIGEGTFASMPSLETFTVSSNVKTIKKHAFESCTKLKLVDLKEADDGASIETIEDEAFKGCTSLTKFRLPATLKKLGNRIFLDCDEDAFKVLVFGGTKAEWNKVEVSKSYKEWTGFKRKNTGMGDWCKNGDYYRNWKNN